MEHNDCILLTVTRIDDDIVSFLGKIGVVFTVFDKQDSGCVAYGVKIGEQRWFVKYASRPDAISYMKNAVAFHKEVTHTKLPWLLNSFDIGNGFALVYEWVNGEVLSTPDFPGREGRNHPASPHVRFRQLPVDQILNALTEIYEVHRYLETMGFIAVDFYDGCIIYDFQNNELHLCDFDHYTKGAFTLDEDRFIGIKPLYGAGGICARQHGCRL